MSPKKINAVFLEYRGDSIGLVSGENVVGRNVDCRIRFNDPAVSRRHMRFIVLDERLLAEDLDSTNGTRINGARLTDTRELQSGDVVEIGSRQLRVSLVVNEEQQDDAFAEKTAADDGWPGQESESSDGDRFRRPTPSHGVIAVQPEVKPVSLPNQRTCPRCRSSVSFETSECDNCGYRWRAGLPMAVTQRFSFRDLKGAERRQHPRVTVEIPVIYNSKLLCFDAVARDLSLGGVFLATDLLDEGSTECHVTLLPDGGQALALKGIVRRVVQVHTGADGRPPGMGIQFVEMDDHGREALGELVGRHSALD